MNPNPKTQAATRSRVCYKSKRARGLVRLSCWISPANLPLFRRIQELPWQRGALSGIITPEEWRALMPAPPVAQPWGNNQTKPKLGTRSSGSGPEPAGQGQFNF